MADNLTTKTVNGVKWSTASTIVNSIMQLGYTAIMARLLTSADFGLVALAGVVLRFGGYFANMGLGQTLIQKAELTKEDIRAAFTCSVLLGLAFVIIVWIFAPWAAQLFGGDNLTPILRVMAFSFLLTGLSSTSVSLLRRNIQFKELAIVEIISYILGYLVIGVILASNGYGVWSLVYASMGQILFVFIISYILSRHSIKFLFGWDHYRHLFSYGGRMSMVSFAEFIGSSMDTMIIGKTLGTTQLGFYNRGFMLVNLPLFFLTTSFSKVLFPSFSRIQSDQERLRKVYLSSITLVASILIPLGVGIFVAGEEIVLVMLGENWRESISVLRILAISIPLSLINMFAGIVCDATANLVRKLILTIAHIIIVIAFFILLRGLGLTGFALAVVSAEIIRTFMYMLLMNKVLKVSLVMILLSYLPGLINGAVVGLGIYGITLVLKGVLDYALLMLILQVMTGGVLLFCVILIIPNRRLKQEIQNFLGKINISKENPTLYNKLMLSYINYLNKK